MILNCKFEKPVVINTDETLENCEFVAGTTAKQSGVFGLTVAGDANVTVKGCTFKDKAYSDIYLNTTGKVLVEDCDFDVIGVKNPIEGNIGGAALDKITLKDLRFTNKCGNNYINFYNLKEGATINLENIKINKMSQQSECMRISNTTNATATFNIKNLNYDYDLTTAYDENWTKAVLCQDHTANQDFTKLTLNCEDIICEGQKAMLGNFKVGDLLVVCNKDYSINTTNVPTVNMK